MGAPRSALFLAPRIKDYVGIETHVPEMGESVEISLLDEDAQSVIPAEAEIQFGFSYMRD